MTALIVLIVAMAGVSAYALGPQLAQARERKRAAERQAAAEASATRRAAEQAHEEAQLGKLRADPVSTLSPQVNEAINPAALLTADKKAAAEVEQAGAARREAADRLAEAEQNAPAWWSRPVLRGLVAIAIVLFAATFLVGAVLDYLMLHSSTGPRVALVFAVVIPTLIFGAASLTSWGMNWHSRDGVRTTTQRTATAVGVLAIAGIILGLWQLAPLRTAEAHARTLSQLEATHQARVAENADSPDTTPQAVVDAAAAAVTAAKTNAANDAVVQRVFSVGVAGGEALFGEVALMSLGVRPVLQARRRDREAEVKVTKTRQTQDAVVAAKNARVQAVANETVAYLVANGIPNPRETTLRIIAEAVRMTPIAIDTTDVNLGLAPVTGAKELPGGTGEPPDTSETDRGDDPGTAGGGSQTGPDDDDDDTVIEVPPDPEGESGDHPIDHYDAMA